MNYAGIGRIEDVAFNEWRWWIARAAGVVTTFLGIMGFFYVADAPMKKADELLPAFGGAVAIEVAKVFTARRRSESRHR